MPNLFKKFLVGASLCLITLGCSTMQSSEPTNYALTSIFSAIEKAMSMGIQGYSQNHREFYSRPFLVKQDEKVMKSGLRERGIAKVVVLGESRPYTIETQVVVERNRAGDASDYSKDRYDHRLAKKLLTSILSILDKREHNKNAIDDFRPF